MLFVGESPASGRFFYRADSGLYRAIRQTFLSAFPDLKDADFLESFRQLDYYLVDLCGSPVDRLTGNSAGSRARRAKRGSAQSLGGSILKLWSRSSAPSEPTSHARRLARRGKAPLSNCCIRAAGRRTGLHSNELSGPCPVIFAARSHDIGVRGTHASKTAKRGAASVVMQGGASLRSSESDGGFVLGGVEETQGFSTSQSPRLGRDSASLEMTKQRAESDL
jgi:hypothetical protein